MKTPVLVALILFSTITTNATNYYFSVEGDDTRSASSAQNPATPWKTLNKLNQVFSSLKPGDALLLKRGDTFYGSILVNKSGTKAAPISIGAYGSGDDPVVTGLVALSWNSAGKNIWISNEALQLPSLNMVTVNYVPAGMGRWPNLDNGNGGYNTIASSSAQTITDKKGLSTSPSPGKPTYLVGSEIVVRSTRWLLDRHPVTGYDKNSSTIKFDKSSSNESARKNMGYFIQDNSSVLDKQNEWWYNRSNKKIKIYSDGSPVRVSAANIENLLVSFSKSYITLVHITFDGSNADAININQGSNFIIKSCTIKNAGRNAIKTTTASCSFLNNTILDVMSKGIWLKTGAANCIIRYNNLRNVSEIAGLGTSQQEDGAQSYSGDGVYIKEIGAKVEYNSFVNMGYAAIHLTKVDGVAIRYNFIDTVCNVFDDGGGIYSFSGKASKNYARKITNNIILHGIGAPYGSGVDGNNSEGAGVAGIYNDLNTSDVEIDSNTVAYFEKGIFINYGCERLKITHNNLYNNLKGMQINTRLLRNDKSRNLSITGNVALAAALSQKAMYIYSDDGDVLDKFGEIDSNYYARPIDDKITMSWQNDTKSKSVNGSLSDWHAKFKMYDINSKKSPKDITNTAEIRFEYNATGIKKTIALNGSYIDAKGNKYANNLILQPFRSAILIKSTDSTQNQAPQVVITGTSANLNTSTKSITISVTANDSDGSVVKVEFYNGTTLLGADDTSPYTFTWNNVATGNYQLTAKATDNGGLSTTSGPVTIAVANNKKAPAVAITSPAPNTKFATSSSIGISAAASDSDGSISKVEFYNGTTLINTQHTSPYTFTWENVPDGTCILTAKATDNDGLVTTSPAVKFSVSEINKAPSVAITSPAANAKFASSSSIIIRAAVTDSNSSISKVEFYNGTTLINTQHIFPYTFTWKNVPAGTCILTAKATDKKGLVTTSPAVKVYFMNTDTMPAVSITSPTSNGKFASRATINVTAIAADSYGSIKKIEFYNGTALIHVEENAPYTWNWKNLKAGTYTLTAKAYNNAGLTTISSPVTINVSQAVANVTSSDMARGSAADDVAIAGEGHKDIYEDKPVNINIRLWPNPASTILSISSNQLINSKGVKVSLLSASGSLIKTITSNGGSRIIEVNVSSLKPGIYTMRLSAAGVLLDKKFAKL